MMLQNKRIVALVLVCLLAMMGWFIWPDRADNISVVNVPSNPPLQPKVDSADHRVQALTAELAHLRAQMEKLARQVQNPVPGVVEQESADDAQREQPKVNRPFSREEEVARHQEAQAQAQQLRDAIVTQIEGRLAAEEPDSIWSNQAMVSLQANLQTPTLSGSHFTATSCGSTLCRVALIHDSEEAEDIFMEEVVEFETFANTETFYTRSTQADGSVVVTMYVARQGQKLPMPGRRQDASSQGIPYR